MRPKTFIHKIGKRSPSHDRSYPTLNLPAELGFEPGDTVEIIPTVYQGHAALILSNLSNLVISTEPATPVDDVGPHTCNNLNIARKGLKKDMVLRSGFEPESSARKAGMIGRTTLSEHVDFALNERLQHSTYQY